MFPTTVFVLLHSYSFSIFSPTPLYSFIFFFNDTATTEIYTLSLHEALPISIRTSTGCRSSTQTAPMLRRLPTKPSRSEEHTSELQSLTNLVCRLLLEKKKENI